MSQTRKDAALSAELWLASHGDEIADAMFPNSDAPEDLKVKTIASTPNRLVMMISGAGTSVIVKAFNTKHAQSVVGRYREIAVLLSLGKTGLVPRVRAHSREANWIMSDYVEGCGLGTVVTAANLSNHSTSLGAWYAAYTDAVSAQAEVVPSDWFTYLSQYRVLAGRADFSPHRETLAAMPIGQRVVAKNDPHLQNFILARDGSLKGLDFEKSEMKPYGWDLLVTARILVRQFPNRLPEILDAMLSGWGRGTDTLDPASFAALMRIFASSSAFAQLKDTRATTAGS